MVKSSTRSIPAPAMTAPPALGTGERRKKYDLRVAAYGTLDEANAAIGIARLHTADDGSLDAALSRIQNDLFDVGADLCTPGKGKGPGGARLTVTDAQVDLARRRNRPAQCRACAAEIVRPAGRQRGGGLSASRPHHLPARRAARSPSSRTSRARASATRCCNTSIACPISCSSPAAMPTAKARATCCGSRATIADSVGGKPWSCRYGITVRSSGRRRLT